MITGFCDRSLLTSYFVRVRSRIVSVNGFAICNSYSSLEAKQRFCHGRSMKRLVILLVSIAFSTLVQAQETSAEREVWQKEEAYWRYVSSGDSKSFKTL